jgi:hypothetical protein
LAYSISVAGKHKKIAVAIPSWVNALTPNDACLRSVAEDVYTAKAFAESYGATEKSKVCGLAQRREQIAAYVGELESGGQAALPRR